MTLACRILPEKVAPSANVSASRLPVHYRSAHASPPSASRPLFFAPIPLLIICFGVVVVVEIVPSGTTDFRLCFTPTRSAREETNVFIFQAIHSSEMVADNSEKSTKSVANGSLISTVSCKDELPNAIIVTQVPEDVFDNKSDKANFSSLFTQIEKDIHFDFLRSFRRVRVIFSSPENATAAKLIVQGFSFKGHELKAFFAQRIYMSANSQMLQPPPLEKQFLISPPCSPPVGWEQTKEMAPVVCNFDLMARLASFAIDEKYEVHNGDESTPTIVVHPCETPLDIPAALEMPRTPRPSSPAEDAE